MLAESKPVDRWLRPDIWLPVMTKTYYFAEKMKKLESEQWLLKKKKRLGDMMQKCTLKIHQNVRLFSVTTL